MVGRDQNPDELTLDAIERADATAQMLARLYGDDQTRWTVRTFVLDNGGKFSRSWLRVTARYTEDTFATITNIDITLDPEGNWIIADGLDGADFPADQWRAICSEVARLRDAQ